MAARIYADVTGNKCSCGGKFTKRIPHPDDESIIVPKCDKCNSYPPMFLIDADAIDANGGKIRAKIRHTQKSDRLDRIGRVIYTVETIDQEIKDGTFDVRKYTSVATRERFIFKNYVSEYLNYHEPRVRKGEISPKGLDDKRGLIKRELLPFFGNTDISTINGPLIKKFTRSYMDKNKDRTRDLALGELKTILRQAWKEGLLIAVPPFDPIPKAEVKDEVIDLELAIQTVAKMHKQMYRDMYAIMLFYPIRPCEVRALKWGNVDFENNEFTVDHHFSSEIRIYGRKSIKRGEMKTMTYPMSQEIREIFLRYRNDMRVTPINWKDDYIFKNRFGRHIAEDTLRDSWVNARKKIGHKFKAYECRHAITSEIYIRSGGDLIATSKITGHTTTTVLAKRYVRVKVDKKKLLNIQQDIV